MINVACVKDWIDRTIDHDGVLRIFSFAIWSDKDKDDFKNNLKKPIEDALGFPVVEWLSVDEMATLSTKRTGIKWFDRTDFIQLRGKHGAFFDMILGDEAHRGSRCVLVDDAVPNRTMIDHDLNLTADLLPLDVLLKNWRSNK